ncbi:deoxyribonuclease IV [Buchnera aphidicola]|uniref:deoxyribonuclease IV n=1 Tax=Buchnera aphidicola TaxID=9 RepID=UPI00059F7CB2|nr:deoxyribonuclease IV [Buchnera aphidicola]
MKYIGVHCNTSGGLEKSVLQANKLNATAFSFFVKNPLRWNTLPLQQSTIKSFRKFCNKYNYSTLQILPHSSYLINLGHPDKEKKKKSCKTLIEEINFCNLLGLVMINIHPGSSLKKITEKKCLENISNSINYILKKTNNIIIVLENTSGQGGNMGYCFEHLAFIINKVRNKSRIGVCLDTCHLFASGYQLNNKNSFLNIFYRFHELIGLKYLRGIHLNDSKGKFNSKLDRHENLGYGNIKTSVFSKIVRVIEFNNIPIILETKDASIWKKEIQWLKKQSLLPKISILNF